MPAIDTVVRMRYRYLPDHVIGEILTKRWVDNAIPFIALIAAIITFGSINPAIFTPLGLYDLAGQTAEFALVAIGVTVVMISGGIDLSVGSLFAVSVLSILTCLNVWGLPLWLAVAITCATGAVCGAVNGYLIGYLRLRAFLTTLVTLITFRAIFELIFPHVSTAITLNIPDSVVWERLGIDSLFGLPYSAVIFAIIALFWHLVLSRSRPGWHLAAIGGARRSAYNAGVNVRRVVFFAYVSSGVMCALSAILFSARLGSAGADVGIGMEMEVLVAVVLGGVTLGGGRGSVAKALMGAIIVLLMNNGLLQMGVVGPISSMILGIVLLLAVFLDVRWVKNKNKLVNSTYVSPAYYRHAPCPETDPGSGSVYAVNDALRSVEVIGLGVIEGPEDVLVDRNDNVYCGTRHGDIVRFLAPDYKKHEVFAHIGGFTLGMNFDRDDNLVVCVGMMGVYMVTPDRKVVKLTDETNRSPFSVIDDSRLRDADDLDIAHDGRVFFSDATVRYNTPDWALDAIECRGNGRLICYDPGNGSTRTVLRNLIFPNGICMCRDNESLLFVETWACRISRYWFDGPKRGKLERVVENLPGYPDNINRASGGNYWVALVGMRGPALDLSLTMPGFRRRMSRQVSPANWLYANINTGCVIKITEEGNVLESYWDKGGVNHPMVTSMKEHKGYLYIGGFSNNRIGRWKVPGADPDWTGPDSYWGMRP